MANPCQSVCRALASDSFYVAYSTADHVVGVMAWPLDGDPSKSLGLVAHPGRIAGMNLSHDGCKLVTAGVDDGSIMVWRVLSPSHQLLLVLSQLTLLPPVQP